MKNEASFSQALNLSVRRNNAGFIFSARNLAAVGGRIRQRNVRYQCSVSSPLDGIRINKCFKSFASRREADFYIEQGRVSVNGTVAQPGLRVFSGDVVTLDNERVQWERLARASDTSKFVYLKHWKDMGVVCTTDDRVPNNIVSKVNVDAITEDRIFPVGRLDEASTGIILLTSDGRLPNAVLGAEKDCLKEYLVTPDMRVTTEHLLQLRKGVLIKTFAQRDNSRKPHVAPTLPCECERYGQDQLYMKLKEGRNRQIRKMLGVLGYTVRKIHRIGFMGITLTGLDGPGSSAELTDEEMALVRSKLDEWEGR